MTRTIHLVFKTHLDIGFTDYAARVTAQYHERFIPQAIDTGEHFYAEDSRNPRFIWTTGAWLVWEHLNTQSAERVKRLERAIERGLIRWHALPFTTHSELMSPALFRAGLSYSAELDRRFGTRTIAAKMTDVPGHTIGIVPLLAEAGVEFLHLGVNPASPVPDVPDVFRWRAPEGSEIVVMYQKSYGETHFPIGMDDGLGFAHTNDNAGPQSVPQVADTMRHLQSRFTDATIRAATLEDYAPLLLARRHELPVIESEIGDSWIHGAATDPDKLKRFLALQRLYDRFAAEEPTPQRLAFGRGLTLVAEHTWGVDIKSYLRDDRAWDRPVFAAARGTDHRFRFAEGSWAEQRAYLDSAVAELTASDRVEAERAGQDDTRSALDGWSVDFHPITGDVAAVRSPAGARLEGEGGSLLGYRYESYDHKDAVVFSETYRSNNQEWALLDFGKPGLEHAQSAISRQFVPRIAGAAIGLEPPAHDELGGPRQLAYHVRALDEHRLLIEVELIDKPANRMPEASFVMFTPAGERRWEFQRMGLWLAAEGFVGAGGGHLQAVGAVRAAGLELSPLDTPLVAPAAGTFMRFDRQPPDFSGGLRFNLHNNRWGTNFPMWWGTERFTARFLLTL